MMLLNILVTPAFANGANQTQQGNLLFQLLPLVLIFAVFYFLLIRPQQKKAKEHKKMVTELTVGDEVITQGGILGKIVDTDDTFLHIEISPSVIITSQRGAISTLMPKGTYKNNHNNTTEKIPPKPRRRTSKKTNPETSKLEEETSARQEKSTPESQAE